MNTPPLWTAPRYHDFVAEHGWTVVGTGEWEKAVEAAGFSLATYGGLGAIYFAGDICWDEPQRRVRYAANDWLKTQEYEYLAGDPEPRVRAAVASHSRTSKKVLTYLAGDDAWEVRAKVANNENTPASVLTRILENPDADIVARAMDRFVWIPLAAETITARFRDAVGHHILRGRPGYGQKTRYKWQALQPLPLTPLVDHPLTHDADAQQQWVGVATSLQADFDANGLPNRPTQTAACDLMARTHPEERHLVDMHQVLGAARLLTPKARNRRPAHVNAAIAAILEDQPTRPLAAIQAVLRTTTAGNGQSSAA